jgi:DNA polymerase-3 subunit gamma/tau
MAKRKPAASDTQTPSAGASSPEYTVLARRYRPQQFADLVGQEPVARALVNALQSQRVAHAYLFTGARGVGKTSTARILAKALNCVRGPTATPCDNCDICRSIAAGEDIDVLEIDGASNRKIDEIREIRGNVQYRPSRARYKIYIIDEVHMLTREAFNALLKTLEEPPPPVKFIFATTEVEKVPVTILSRCQRFEFAGIGTSRIIDRLRQIVHDEGMECEDEALEHIARRAGGSMRDAQSLLDQLLAFGEEKLTLEHVHRLLGTAHDDRVLALATAVLARDPKQALGLLDEAASEGLQLGELLDQLILYWRDLLVVNCAGPNPPNLSVPARYRDTLAQQAADLSVDTILAGLDVLSTTKARLRYSHHARVLVEMALIRLGRLENLVALAQLAQRLDETGEAGKGAPAPASKAAQRSSPSRPPTPVPVTPPEAVKKKGSAAVEATEARRSGKVEEGLAALWPKVLGQLGQFLCSSLEKAGLPAIIGPNTLVLQFATEYNLQRELCQEAKNLERIEEVLRKLTGTSWKVRVEPSRRDASASPQAPPTSNGSTTPRRRTEVEHEPMLRRAIELLGARIHSEEAGFGELPADATGETGMTDGEEG